MQASDVDQAGVAMSKHEIAAPSNAVIAQRLEATGRLLEDQGSMKGQRVVRGRELETWYHYHGNFPQATA